MKVHILSELIKVVDVQATSLRSIKKHIGSSYVKAVKWIFNCRGKVICTGIGKSGLVAEKLAATLASTGTMAIFLHPAEGLHGNLGVVSKKDIVIAFGKSGESEEILNLIPSIKKIGAKLISITANKNSTLARHSHIVLHTPIKREVCPLNLAPTTSTTIGMVVGDAIAITLMKLRGFNSNDFALYHPGGLLGKKLLLRVSDVMRSGKNNPKVKVNSHFNQLLLEITQKGAGAASIIDKKNKFIGLVTDFDLRQLLSQPEKLGTATIAGVMNKNATAIYDDALAWKALQLMENRKKPFTVLPVINHKKESVGIIHIHDFIIRGLVQSDK